MKDNPSFEEEIVLKLWVIYRQYHGPGLNKKDFRPAYTKLNLLGSFMPKTPILALTETATACYQKEIKRSLGMQNVINVEANPNRETIFYRVLPRNNRGDEKLIDVIKPYALELKEKVISSPLTIFYSNLETCGRCYRYLEQELGEQQFYPPGSPANFSNRLFAQYNAQYLEEYRTRPVKSLISGTSVTTVLFVTVSFGVGIDVPTVERVIHIGIPYTMEDVSVSGNRTSWTKWK
ncbi:putative ATP-dependent DNA helicase Q1 [Montipora foliosa]|uniref:putative ATP-dependent DNA helicase Q1 n=1 Tax=Montipora foliosa TaxID=591990 RepID=UPI0035F1941F